MLTGSHSHGSLAIESHIYGAHIQHLSWPLAHSSAPHPLGGLIMNQGAITECLPAAPLPVCDSLTQNRTLDS